MMPYSDTQWADVEIALEHLKPKDYELRTARVELERAIELFLAAYFLAGTDRPPRERIRTAAREWAQISQLIKKLEPLWHSRVLDTPPLDWPPAFQRGRVLREIRRGLTTLKTVAKVSESQAKSEILEPKARALFHSTVLNVWTRLGGELKISKHPDTHKTTGPLARYFAAATQCVHGGSLETLRDIVKRHKRHDFPDAPLMGKLWVA